MLEQVYINYNIHLRGGPDKYYKIHNLSEVIRYLSLNQAKCLEPDFFFPLQVF